MDNQKRMPSLAEIVSVQQSSTRSVNVVKDFSKTDISKSYILTVQARHTLRRLINNVQLASPQRAWTLTGPYGSGKSYFGLFLMSLLSSTSSAHADAQQKLETVDTELWKDTAYLAQLGTYQGLLPIPITGYRAPIQECIRQGLQDALAPLQKYHAVRTLVEELLDWDSGTPSHRLGEIIQELLTLFSEKDLGYTGIILILDEMGKPLEYTAAHPDRSDIYLLQEIAEIANRSGDTPFLFVGMLHQSFERYAGISDSLTQREWSKIQGRFEDIAFQEPPTQQMGLLANALHYSDQKALPTAWYTTTIGQAIDEEWTPALLQEDEFRQLCQKAAIFHPTTFIAIPYLFQKLAQNERSIFAYLTSSEPNGFQSFLQSAGMQRQVLLADLFDYLASNYQGRLYSTLRARPLTEALERIESTPNLLPLDVRLLKTIGLLNWLAEIGPFQASAKSLHFAVSSDDVAGEQIAQRLETLERQSTIVFRRFNQSYVIWQGSDVDIEERLQDARRHHLDGFSVAQAIQEYLPPQPVVARRHSHHAGTTRFFETQYIDWRIKDGLSLSSPESASGLVLLCLPETANEEANFMAWAKQEVFVERGDLVIGVFSPISRLVELMTEMRSLHWVRSNTPELRDDPVARRELRTRLNELESIVKNELDITIRLHRVGNEDGVTWIYCGEEANPPTNRGVSSLISSVCDRLYAQSPILRNEILNRQKLSSQGAAARRNLIEAMLFNADKPQLGIEGYPPERSMYESILRAGELHRQKEDGFWYLCPPSEANPLNLQKTWDCIHSYIFAQPPQPRGVDDLYEMLSAPPFGLKDGVLPLIFCHFVQIYKDEVTLYIEGTLLPEPTIADWEVLLRRPELYSVAGCRISGPRKAIIERLAKGLGTNPSAMPVVRDLIRRLKSLPEYTWRTHKLSKKTLQAREAIDHARSPETLLFHDLPEAFGLKPFVDSEEIDETEIQRFFGHLNGALQELNDAMPVLLAQARDQLLDAFRLQHGEEGWYQFLTIARQLAPKVEQAPLAPLLRRAAEANSVESALESALAYAANRPPRSWTDRDQESFEGNISSIGNQFVRAYNNHYLDIGLTDQQRKESEKLAASLDVHLSGLKGQAEPLVIQAALHKLLQEYQAKNEQVIQSNGRLL